MMETTERITPNARVTNIAVAHLFDEHFTRMSILSKINDTFSTLTYCPNM